MRLSINKNLVINKRLKCRHKFKRCFSALLGCERSYVKDSETVESTSMIFTKVMNSYFLRELISSKTNSSY